MKEWQWRLFYQRQIRPHYSYLVLKNAEHGALEVRNINRADNATLKVHSPEEWEANKAKVIDEKDSK